MLRLAITRTPEQLTEVTHRAQLRGVEIIPLPVISVNACAFDWPQDLAIEKVDWIFFTSANAVSAFFDRLVQLGKTLADCTRLAAVGAKTAQALAERGHATDFVPSDAYGRVLFEEFLEVAAHKGQTIVYARGADVNYDPATLFKGHDISYFPIVCYETKSQPVKTETIAQLTNSDYILFTAPSTVDAYHGQFGKPVAKPIAIGRSTAAQMNQFGWFGFITMKNADIDNILEYL